jgi:membrane protease subunit HflC
MSVFSVDQREHVVKFQFQKIVKADYEPGLHFKIPFVNDIARYPKRILTYEPAEEKFLTGEKKNLIVVYFVTWRIVDPSQYYRSVGGVEDLAVERLSAIVKEGLKAAISQRTVQAVVSAERTELMADMLTQVRARSPELGIQVVDVRVKRIDLSDEVSDSAYQRMQQERHRVATQLRAEGDEQYQRIKSDAERQRAVTLSEAYRDSERIRGLFEGSRLLRVLPKPAGLSEVDRTGSRCADIEAGQRLLSVSAEAGRYDRALVPTNSDGKWGGLRLWPGLIFLRAWPSTS